MYPYNMVTYPRQEPFNNTNACVTSGKLAQPLFDTIKDNGICAVTRGCKAGRNRQRTIRPIIGRIVIWVFALDDNLDQFCYRLSSTNYTHICLILGLKSCVDMKLVKLIISVDDIGTTVDTYRHFSNDDVRLNQLLDEYSDLFDGIG